jgi:hypothetical protein
MTVLKFIKNIEKMLNLQYFSNDFVHIIIIAKVQRN